MTGTPDQVHIRDESVASADPHRPADHRPGAIDMVGLFVVVTLSRLAFNANRYVFQLFPDEPGVLAMARWFSGRGEPWAMGWAATWKPGYSILVAPAYWLSDDPHFVYRAGLAVGAVLGGVAAVLLARIALRMTTAVGLATLVTMTTSLARMMAVVRWLATPLRVLGLRTRGIELAVALVIRFTPVLADKGQLLAQSWRARSARRVGWRILMPFAVLAIDDAERVAEALRARGGL